MILNNFYNIFRDQTLNGTSLPCTTMTGATQTLYYAYRASDFYGNTVANSDNTNGWKVQVGTNDTEPAATDYAIATTGLTRVSTVANSCSSIKQFHNVTSVYRNDTESDIIIKEVALSFGVNNSSNTKECIFFRKVLSSSVTIAPGEQYSFTYTTSIS